ncbi:hypothetical protein GLOIN_2v1877656 [Rhizophagus clarus]|uniref:Uncharacterized protein n=1 Tax=Rhizophagus clarus TaxID=94130 RepID=A0A8H3L7R2_9GLOM|nr:hypothetical protein GLOIN_2v1877656 [Rhizophagus clarus]
MNKLCTDMIAEIFKYVSTPLPLIIIYKNWYDVSQLPHVRAEWLIYKYRRAHALFHAVRLGKCFITEEVVHVLLANKAILSRYFVQWLIKQFGQEDLKLIEMRKMYNTNGSYKSWVSDLSLPLLNLLLTEATNLYVDNLAINGNDFELFHYLTGRNLQVIYVADFQSKYIQCTDDLILKKKFIPFPARPRIAHFPPIVGYENNRELNIIARAIIFQPELVSLWKRIGYNEVCSDFNELVLEGFQLTDLVIEESLDIFESRINIIGELLLEAFSIIRGKSTPSIVELKLKQVKKFRRRLKCKRKFV